MTLNRFARSTLGKFVRSPLGARTSACLEAIEATFAGLDDAFCVGCIPITPGVQYHRGAPVNNLDVDGTYLLPFTEREVGTGLCVYSATFADPGYATTAYSNPTCSGPADGFVVVRNATITIKINSAQQVKSVVWETLVGSPTKLFFGATGINESLGDPIANEAIDCNDTGITTGGTVTIQDAS